MWPVFYILSLLDSNWMKNCILSIYLKMHMVAKCQVCGYFAGLNQYCQLARFISKLVILKNNVFWLTSLLLAHFSSDLQSLALTTVEVSGSILVSSYGWTWLGPSW